MEFPRPDHKGLGKPAYDKGFGSYEGFGIYGKGGQKGGYGKYGRNKSSIVKNSLSEEFSLLENSSCDIAFLPSDYREALVRGTDSRVGHASVVGVGCWSGFSPFWCDWGGLLKEHNF